MWGMNPEDQLISDAELLAYEIEALNSSGSTVEMLVFTAETRDPGYKYSWRDYTEEGHYCPDDIVQSSHELAASILEILESIEISREFLK